MTRPLGAVFIALGLLVPTSVARGAVTEPDRLHRVVDRELVSFTEWLRRNEAEGFVGEVGWPIGKSPAEDRQWTQLAERWFAHADAAGLWATAWLTTELWGTAHQLTPYASPVPNRPVSLLRPQAAVLERHRTTKTYFRGVNYSGGETGFMKVDPVSPMSSVNRGVHGVDYSYGSEATYAFLASRGVKLVRLPFRWERLQPRLYAPLDPEAVRHLREAVARIRKHGMVVVLDMHNFAGYYGSAGERLRLGTRALPTKSLVDAWTRLSRAFRNERGIIAYDIMNEPAELGLGGARTWEAASQAVVTAIRRTGDTRLLMIEGYEWSGLHAWARTHPKAWITDPADNIRYSPHHYWDSRHSSQYGTYDLETQRWGG